MKLNKLIITIVTIASMLSCKKVIDIQETDLIAGSIALKTVNNCEQAIIGGYASVGVETGILLNSTFSDEVKPAEFYNAQTTHEWSYSSTDVGIRDNFTPINGLYAIVDRVNRVLEALPKSDSTRVGDIVLRSKLRGEALFLRAFAHFELFRYYCGNYEPTGLAMPYLETPSLTPQARIVMSQYFQKLNADITEAKTLLPNNLLDINRANRTAASALQARIALYTKDWANAATFATEFINTIPLASRANFPGIWTDANTNELAFRLIRTSANRIGSLWRGTSATSSATGITTITWRPSDKLWNSYDQVNDVRFASYFKNEPSLTALTPSRPSRLVAKYVGTGYGTTNENVNSGKVYRTAEMYLIRAEARAELGLFTGANSAETDLNDLRAARISGYTNMTMTSKQMAIDAILLERFKELPFEGHRFWDLKRRGLPVERLLSDTPSPQGTTLTANNFRFVLPIPDPEIKANVLMVQNTGY
jgi:starch-binding outer membrane protein, SusD/RagB family